MKTDFSPENKRILLYHPSVGNRRSGSSLFWEKIEKFSDGNKITYLDRSFSPSPITGDRTYSLDVLPLEYSSNGLGDFRTSALDVRNEFGVTLDLKYKEYRLYKGKRTEGLPASFGNQEEVESLEIDLYDQLTDITVTLQYSVLKKLPISHGQLQFKLANIHAN